MPKVSIVVPVYNSEKYLRATLESAIHQTFTDIEIICIDDGSTDTSSSIIEHYRDQDERIKVFTQKNGGGSAARNTGIKHASADYIMFLDSDDMYALDLVANAYDRAIDTGADIVFYNFARFVRKPTRLAVLNRNAPENDIRVFTKDTYADHFFNDFAIITWNKLIKKSVIAENDITFDTSLSHNHDVDFSIRLMLAANSYSWLSMLGYYYRTNNDGLTATKRSDPTNVLKILLKLDTQVTTKYGAVKPSFNNYIVDTIVGTVMKYRHDKNKVMKICDFSHDVVIPKTGVSSEQSNYTEPSGIFTMIETGKYAEVMAYITHPKQKTRAYMRTLYDDAQDLLARFTV